VLACAAYFSLIPLFQKQVSDARKMELELVRQVFSADIPVSRLKGLETYDFQSGTATDLQVPRHVRTWLDANPGEIWWEARNPYTYRPGSAQRGVLPYADGHGGFITMSSRGLG